MCTKVYNPCWWRGTWFEKTHIYWERWKPAWLIDETSGIVYGFLTGLKIAILKKNNGMDGKYRKWLDLDEKKNWEMSHLSGMNLSLIFLYINICNLFIDKYLICDWYFFSNHNSISYYIGSNGCYSV